MAKFLPFIFLTSVLSFFGQILIIWYLDPQNAPWYVFLLFSALTFIFFLGFVGTVVYFARVRVIKRYNSRSYFYSSFKLAFFVAFTISLIVGLKVSQLFSVLNLFLVILAVVLFAVWSYLGKKLEKSG